MGIDYRLFWTLNPRKMMPFAKAYRKIQEERTEQLNFCAWLTGIYMTYSASAVMGGNEAYPEKPVALFQNEESIAQRQEQESKLFSAYAAMFNAHFDTKKEKEVKNDETSL